MRKLVVVKLVSTTTVMNVEDWIQWWKKLLRVNGEMHCTVITDNGFSGVIHTSVSASCGNRNSSMTYYAKKTETCLKLNTNIGLM